MYFSRKLRQGLYLLILFCGINQIYAQQKTHELGLRTTDLENFSFIYKKQKRSNQFIRYRLLLASLNYQETSNQNFFRGAFDFAIGKEYRKNISERFQLLHGFEPEINIRNFTQASETALNLHLSLGYVFGFQYKFAENFFFNIEARPQLVLGFQFRGTGFDDIFSANAYVNSTRLAMGLLHQFQTKK